MYIIITDFHNISQMAKHLQDITNKNITDFNRKNSSIIQHNIPGHLYL